MQLYRPKMMIHVKIQLKGYNCVFPELNLICVKNQIFNQIGFQIFHINLSFSLTDIVN